MSDRRGIGGNEPPAYDVSLPSDRSEASKILYNRLVKLAADKRAYSDSARDLLKDAKVTTKIKPRVVRLGLKLSRMSPEKRELWAEELSEVAPLVGFSRLEVADTERSGKLWELVEAVAVFEHERREISEHVRDLVKYAKERGDIDVRSIRKLASMAHKDRDDVADEWAGIDTMATFLGLW